MTSYAISDIFHCESPYKRKYMPEDTLSQILAVLRTLYKHRIRLIEQFAKKMTGREGAEWEKQARLFLEKEPCWIGEPKRAQTPEDKPVVSVDTLIQHKRGRPEYPSWVKTVLYRDLEREGPRKYDISQIKQWLHPKQIAGKSIDGNEIHEFLVKQGVLFMCLGLSDLLAIREKGQPLFEFHFDHKLVIGWRSIVEHKDGKLRVPYLEGKGTLVILQWMTLDTRCGRNKIIPYVLLKPERK